MDGHGKCGTVRGYQDVKERRIGHHLSVPAKKRKRKYILLMKAAAGGRRTRVQRGKHISSIRP